MIWAALTNTYFKMKDEQYDVVQYLMGWWTFIDGRGVLFRWAGTPNMSCYYACVGALCSSKIVVICPTNNGC